jgi:YbbR domain-containing protein
VIEENPKVSKTYDNIPISVINDQDLEDNDLALVKSRSSYATSARVTISINRNDISSFDESSLWVQLDLSRITSVGTHEIKLNSTSPNVERIYPDTIIVEVDEWANRVIPVECEVMGTLENGYHRSALSVSPNTIQVSGAKSIVDQIEKAYLRLDLSDRTESVNLTKAYTFVDSNGTAIDASALKVSFDSVALKMDITPTKEVLLSPSILGQDDIMEGYEIADIIVDPENVMVTGEAEALEGLTSIKLEPIDITDQFENVFVQELNILAPDGVTVLDIESASVLVKIQEQMSQVQFEQVDIELRNIPEGLTAKDFEQMVDITVTAPTTLIDNIVANHITLYVDLTGAEAGETELPILYEAPEEYRVKDVSVSQETASVILE